MDVEFVVAEVEKLSLYSGVVLAVESGDGEMYILWWFGHAMVYFAVLLEVFALSCTFKNQYPVQR